MSGESSSVLDSITKDQVLHILPSESRARARDLWRRGKALLRKVGVDGTLYGMVDDGDIYEVEVIVEGDRLFARCTCDRATDGFCAHVGALLLTWADSRGGPIVEGDVRSLLKAFMDNSVLVEGYRELLQGQSIELLRAIAREYGIAVESTRKEEIANALADELCAPGKMRSIILSLDDLSLDLLIRLHLFLTVDYGLTEERIAAYWSTSHADMSLGDLQQQVARLHRRGLLLSFEDDGMVYYYLPDFVRVNLPPWSQMLPSGDREPAQVRTRTPAAVLQRLYVFWNALVAGNVASPKPTFRLRVAPQRHPIEDQFPQLQNWRHLRSEIDQLVGERRALGGLYGMALTIPPAPYRLRSADRRTLRKRTGCTDEEIEFFCALLEFARFMGGEPGEPLTLNTAGFQKLVKLPPVVQLKLLGMAWLELTSWSEVDIVLRAGGEIRLRRNLIYFSYEPTHFYEELSGGRETIYRFLQVLPEGAWVSLEDFLRLVYEISPDLFHSMSEPGVWWIEDARSKRQFGTGFDDWRRGVGRFVTAVLEGPAYWLGILDLGYEGEKLQAIRLTPVGSYIIGRRTAPYSEASAAETRDAVRLGDDMTIFISPGTAPPQLHELLNCIGELEKITFDYFVYRMVPDKVNAEIARGRSLEELISTLQKLGDIAIPRAWQDRMRAWVQNYGLLHLYDDISLIELADDYALHELQVNTSLAQHIIYQFSPRLIAIRPAAIDVLIQEMEKKGYTPRVIG